MNESTVSAFATLGDARGTGDELQLFLTNFGPEAGASPAPWVPAARNVSLQVRREGGAALGPPAEMARWSDALRTRVGFECLKRELLTPQMREDLGMGPEPPPIEDDDLEEDLKSKEEEEAEGAADDDDESEDEESEDDVQVKESDLEYDRDAAVAAAQKKKKKAKGKRRETGDDVEEGTVV